MASSIVLSDNGVTSGSAGIKSTGGNDGVLLLQTTTSGGTATTAVTVDNAQNVGVGVTPSSAFSSGKSIEVGYAGNAFWSNGANDVRMSANVKYNLYAANGAASTYVQGAGTHLWSTAASGTAGNAITFTQAMTLDSSGNLLVGQTATGGQNSNSFAIQPSTGYSINCHISGTASGTGYQYFNYNGSPIGSITQNGTTGVLYNLTSDYRLKNNQEALTGAKDFIMALKPKKWQWWDGSGEGVGFVAHEFMEVAKYSGHGEKDAVETIEIKDEDGNVTGTEERPVYQSIQPSSSEVMANLVSLIQEQQALIQSLTDRLTALEGAAK